MAQIYASELFKILLFPGMVWILDKIIPQGLITLFDGKKAKREDEE